MAPTKALLQTSETPQREALRMTYDEYVDWYDKEAGRRGEWVDGDVIVFRPATFRHEDIVGFLNALLRIVLRRRRLGVVVGSSYELQTRDGAAREPDLMVVLNEHRDRITERRLVGAADLVVEVVSPDSVARDRRDKLAEYAAAGIPEYWVVDSRPGRANAALYVLGEDGSYVAQEADADGRVWSTVVPGVWLEAAWLTADELPDETELGLVMALTAVDRPAT